MSEDGTSEPIRKIDDATYGVAPESRTRRALVRVLRWFQLDADRHLVAAILLAATFATIVLVGEYGPVTVRSFLTNGVSPGAVLVELLKTIVSVVVIVLSINQLVLSPGLGPVGDQQERYEQSVELRRKVEGHTGVEASPSSPAAFLSVLLDELIDRAERLDEIVSESGPREAADRTGEFADAIVEEATSVTALLDDSRFGRFDVISAALRFAVSEKVRTLQLIRARYGASFSEAESAAFEDVAELLELFTVAREYLKTVYIREEYISLSESLLYTGLPALVVTYLSIQIYHPDVFPGRLFGFERRLLFVAGAVTVSLAPFVVLISYVFRLAPMSRSTLFVGPFDARESDERNREPRDHGR